MKSTKATNRLAEKVLLKKEKGKTQNKYAQSLFQEYK